MQAHQQYLLSLPADRGTPFLPPTWHQVEDSNSQETADGAGAAAAAAAAAASATKSIGASAFTTKTLSETNNNNTVNSTSEQHQQQQARAAGARVKAVLHRRGDGSNGADELVAVTYESRPNTPLSRPSSSQQQQQQQLSTEASADALGGFASGLPDRGLLLGALHGSTSHRFEPGDTWHNASTPLALKKGIPAAMACRRILAHMNRNRPVASSYENTVFVLRDELTGVEVEVDKQSSEPFFWPGDAFSHF